MKHTLRVIQRIDEVESLRPLWEHWQFHPNSDLDQFLLICRQRRDVRRPYIMVVSYQDEPRAMLVARVEEGHVAPSIGYFTPFRFPVVRLAVIYRGWLGQIDDAIASEFLRGLDNALAGGEFDIVELCHLPEESPLHKAVGKMRGKYREGRVVWSVHHDLTLPQEVGGLLQRMKSKHRSWVRRKARELEDAFPGRSRFRTLCAGEDLGALFPELEAVARLTYQRGLGVDFTANAEQQEKFALFNRRKMLRAWILNLNEIPRAYALGVVYGDTFHFSMTGYDPSFRRFELGTLVFHKMVDDLIREGVKKLDFGLGDADYKQRLGDNSWREASLQFYRRGMKSMVISSATGTIGLITRAGRKVADQLGVVNKMKSAWRRHLAAPRQE